MQHQQWMFSLWQQSTITSFKRLLQGPRLHPAPIDKERHVLAAILGQRAIANIAMQSKSKLGTLSGIYHYRIEHFRKGQVIEFRESGGQISRAAGLQGHVFFNRQIKAYTWIADSVTSYQLHDMSALGTRTTHELQTSRHIVKQVAHRYRRPMQTRFSPTLCHFTATQSNKHRRVFLAHRLGLDSTA